MLNRLSLLTALVLMAPPALGCMTVEYDNPPSDPAVTAQIETRIEILCRYVERMLPLPDPPIVFVNKLASREEYLEIRNPADHEPVPEAHYSHGTNTIYIYESPRVLVNLTHEIVHALARDYHDAPIWWREGIAVFFERMDVATSGAVRIRPDVVRRGQISAMYERGPPDANYVIIDHLAYEHVKPEHREKVTQSSLYLFGWSFVYFLHADPQRSDFFQELTRSLQDADRDPLFMKIQREYPGGLKGFSLDWNAFWREKQDPPYIDLTGLQPQD